MLERIVSVEFIENQPVLADSLAGVKPWSVYYEGGVISDGRRVVSGLRYFDTERDALGWISGIPVILLEPAPDCQ